jgi:hypothetical protein
MPQGLTRSSLVNGSDQLTRHAPTGERQSRGSNGGDYQGSGTTCEGELSILNSRRFVRGGVTIELPPSKRGRVAQGRPDHADGAGHSRREVLTVELQSQRSSRITADRS